MESSQSPDYDFDHDVPDGVKDHDEEVASSNVQYQDDAVSDVAGDDEEVLEEVPGNVPSYGEGVTRKTEYYDEGVARKTEYYNQNALVPRTANDSYQYAPQTQTQTVPHDARPMKSHRSLRKRLGFTDFTLMYLLTLINHFDMLLDIIFASSLIGRGGGPEIGWGVALIIGSLWAMAVDYVSKREMNTPDYSLAAARDTAMLAEAVIFSVEDCTMVLAIAGLSDAFSGSDILNIATVAVSIMSAAVNLMFGFFALANLFMGFTDIDNFNWFHFVTVCLWIGSLIFFMHMLIRILATDGLDNSVLRPYHNAAYVFYATQLFVSLVFSLRFALKMGSRGSQRVSHNQRGY